MRALTLLALVAFCLLFVCCKATQPTAPPSGVTPLVIEAVHTLDTIQSKFLQFANSTNGNPWQAIMLTANWAQALPTVQSAQSLDSVSVHLVLKSGLTTTFSFTQLDASGFSLLRGGGGKDAGNGLVAEGLHSTNTIKNPNVLIYAAAYTEFYTIQQMQDVLNYFGNSGLGLNVTLLKDQDCTPQLVETFKNYGFVILDTHGESDAFLSGAGIIIPKALASEDSLKGIIEKGIGSGTYAKFVSGQLVLEKNFKTNPYKPMWQNDTSLHGNYEVWVSTKYLQAIPSMPGTVILGNMCYSGQSTPVGYNTNTPIQVAFTNKDLIAYYGYAYAGGGSSGVSNDFSIRMEDSIVSGLVTLKDSTGNANLQYNGATYSEALGQSKLYLKLFNSVNYSYDGCIDSFVDARDGQVYKAACIGKQIWMAQNLNYNAPGSVCYQDDPKNCAIFGKLYPWNVAMNGAASDSSNPGKVQGVCPKGWHIPSLSEWNQLIVATGTNGNNNAASKALRSTSTDTTAGGWGAPSYGIATNSTGFSALPGGAFGWQNTPLPSGPLARVYGLKSITGRFQSSTLVSSGPWAGFVNGIEIAGDIIPVYRFFGDKDQSDPEQPPMNASCRCVKDP